MNISSLSSFVATSSKIANTALRVGHNSTSVTDLLDASFRGVPFHCQETQDTVSRAIAVHSYPFVDKTELDDMGQKSRQCDIQAIFFGPFYSFSLESFLAALAKGGAGELIHPFFGILKVMVQEYSIKKDADGPDSCRVQVRFVELTGEANFFTDVQTLAGKIDGAVFALQQALQQSRELCRWALARSMQDVEDKNILAANEITTIFASIFNSATEWDDILRLLDRSYNTYTHPAPETGTTTSAHTITTLFANVEQAIARYFTKPAGSSGAEDRRIAWQQAFRVAVALAPTTSDARDAAGFQTGGAGGENVPGGMTGSTGESSWKDGETGLGANVLAVVSAFYSSSLWRKELNECSLRGFDNQESTQTAIVIYRVAQATLVTQNLAEIACELLRQETQDPTLCPVDIEGIVGDMRQRMQDDIVAFRAIFPPHHAYPLTQALRDAAYAVQALGEVIINARPPLVTHKVSTPCNHHLLAHALYKDYKRAPEVLRLNPSVVLPNFIARGNTLNVYSK